MTVYLENMNAIQLFLSLAIMVKYTFCQNIHICYILNFTINIINFCMIMNAFLMKLVFVP